MPGNTLFEDKILSKSLEDVEKVLEPLLIPMGLNSVDSIKNQLNEARDGLKTWQVFYRYLNNELHGKTKNSAIAWSLSIPVVVGILSLVDAPVIFSTFSVVVYTLSVGLGFFTKITAWAKSQIDTINFVEKEVDNEFNEKQKLWDKKIKKVEVLLQKKQKKTLILYPKKRMINKMRLKRLKLK